MENRRRVRLGPNRILIGAGGQPGVTDHDRLHSALVEKSKAGREPLWIVLIGHGTYDGHEAKFNLQGPDLTDAELGDWLISVKRPVVVINCASASGPFINRLSGPNRVVVAATKSGFEMNFSRFGQYLAETITDPQADLDKDGQVSVLEAYLTASSRVEEYYRAHSQLASEHALLDDNGDHLGTPANWFKGVHATQRARDGAALDGIRAHQLHLIPSDREREMPPESAPEARRARKIDRQPSRPEGKAQGRRILCPTRETDGGAGTSVSKRAWRQSGQGGRPALSLPGPRMKRRHGLAVEADRWSAGRTLADGRACPPSWLEPGLSRLERTEQSFNSF